MIHGNATPQIISCAFLPLFKGGFINPEKLDSCRAQMLKIFEYVILFVWGKDLSTDSMQFGFKAGVSITQCTWVVNEVATYFMRKVTVVHACLLDCSRAFAKCRYDKLFAKLLERGLPPMVAL